MQTKAKHNSAKLKEQKTETYQWGDTGGDSGDDRLASWGRWNKLDMREIKDYIHIHTHTHTHTNEGIRYSWSDVGKGQETREHNKLGS